MNRRNFVRFGWATVIATGAGMLRPGATRNYWGVMALKLHEHGYEWDFESALEAPLAGSPASPTFTDMGSGTCHGPANRW